MADILLAPPVAFVLYLVLVGVLFGAGRLLAGKPNANTLKSSTYASGETASTTPAAPGYRSFFVIALFFAVLHLGVLMLGSSTLEPIALLYLLGLCFALIALVLG
ncbi:MAG: hypothetical protein KF716_16725 [Anaerolineae bacterium]|nr:hypothetical protein [Anaerolineae bacterium]